MLLLKTYSKEIIMKNRILYTLLTIFLLAGAFSCSALQQESFTADFDSGDRVWIGKDYWAVPMEDWQVKDGRLECTGERENMRVNLLTAVLNDRAESFSTSVRLGLLKEGELRGYAGFSIGLWDDVDSSAKSLCYFGQGISAGIASDRSLFIEQIAASLPEEFDLSEVVLTLEGIPGDDGYTLTLNATDKNNLTGSVSLNGVEQIRGLVALANKFRAEQEKKSNPLFWFDDWTIKGKKLEAAPENSFGPILWSMYTLSRGTVKLTAQMPPLGPADPSEVKLELKSGEAWETAATASIEADSRTATFRLEDWDAGQERDYRLVYPEDNGEPYYYEGTIRRDPVDKNLRMGGMTCQFASGFPYKPVVDNLAFHNPDILYFSGDQIYESNGGYGIIRFPGETAILNYLGKWYMFGWAFGDLMRDRPTICTPDDHDVFQGNLWGEGGEYNSMENYAKYYDSTGGFLEPPEMVNVVNRTQCSHLPDPYDPTPLKQGIIPFYTDLVYGRVSFAIITDRIFKSGPHNVAYWEGRLDHLKFELKNPKSIDKKGLEFLGGRQMEFLEEWIRDWKGADLKTLLSQTIFTNAATHHGGNKMFLVADLDSGGWPQTGRDRALEVIRKAFAFQIAGDQHIPSLIQYGIKDFRDSSWGFCTPAISVGYERRFVPDTLGIPVKNRPEHGLPNTGEYVDGFGNLNYVYAIGNPLETERKKPRYILAEEKASGYSIITFDRDNRTFTPDAWHFLTDASQDTPEAHFAGWPHTIGQEENYGAVQQSKLTLPVIQVSGIEDPVVEISDEQKGELLYILRIKGASYTPKVTSKGTYKVRVGNPETDTWLEKTGVKPGAGEALQFDF